MPDTFNDKHLLWWILKAIDDAEGYGATRQHVLLWLEEDAPPWALPAAKEKYAVLDAEMPKEGRRLDRP